MALVMLTPVTGPYAGDLLGGVVEPMINIEEVRQKKWKRASGGSTKSIKTPLTATFDTFATPSPGPFEKISRFRLRAPCALETLSGESKEPVVRSRWRHERLEGMISWRR